MAGCAGGPPRAAATRAVEPGRDGPPAAVPTELLRVPDAEPQWEPIRTGGPNKPYEVMGQAYRPMTQDLPFVERGLASWYGRKFHGAPTASGEPYDMFAMTAAHPTLPIPSYVRVRNPANGREVVVRVNDRGPFHPGRIIDLSYTAAAKLDVLRGVAPVELERITFDDIRTGSWRRTAPAAGQAETVAATAASAPTAVAAAAAPAPVSASQPSIDARPADGAGTGPDADISRPVALDAPPVADVAAAAAPEPAPGLWVQLGAFRAREGADSFQRRVAIELPWLAPALAVFNDAAMYRLQAGPYASREQVQSVAQRVRQVLQLVPMIVERR